MRLSYNGGPFHGWQSQPNAVSVQQTIEDALQTMMRHKVPIVGAGRTDTGVNAREMFAHFDTDVPIVDKRRWLNSLNRLCGPDISVMELREVIPSAHARFDAELRRYKYFAVDAKTPFASRFAWTCVSPLDVDAMNEAARILLATDDFTSFAKLHSDSRTNICRVTEAVWEPIRYTTGEQGLVFTIAADRFLRNMVRAVTGTLVDVGRGKMDIDGFREVIERKDRCAAGTSMPAEPLFLWDVVYPEDIFTDNLPNNQNNPT